MALIPNSNQQQRKEFDELRHAQWLKEPHTTIILKDLGIKKETLLNEVMDQISNLGASTTLDATIRNKLIEAATIKKLIKNINENSIV
jgi:hypothetical protein